MSEEVEQTNGASTAPEVFHRALDSLYRWMAETNSPDGMTTIRATDGAPDEPAICADLSVIIYQERDPEGESEPESEPENEGL